MPDFVHHHHHFFHFGEPGQPSPDISALLAAILKEIKNVSQQLDDLTAEVANAVSVEQAAITLIGNIRQQLVDAGTDPAKLQALHDTLANEDAALAAAVAGTSSTTAGAPAPAADASAAAPADTSAGTTTAS